MTAVRRMIAAAGAVAVLAACGDGASSSPSSTSSRDPASAPHSTPTGPTPTDSAPSERGSSPGQVGDPQHPVALTPGDDPLQWRPVPGPTEDLVTVGGGWTLTVAENGATASLAGPHPRTVPAGAHARISDAFLTGTHALVVSEDKLAQTPDVATVVDLASGDARILDRTSSPPTSIGGTWALGPAALAHATDGRRGSYCVTWLSLATLQARFATCVPPHNGLSRATITDSGATFMRFDDHHPSCRTLLAQTGPRATPLTGVARCKGWDSAGMPGGAVWSVIPQEQRVEAAHFYARTRTGWYDLGPGTSGSLVPCGGAAYFARDPATRRDPATLLRWDPLRARLDTVFASKGRGNAFLSPPRCGGDHLTVTAFSTAGDQQVTAAVGAP